MTAMKPPVLVNQGTTFRIITDTPFTAVDGTIVDPDIVWFGYMVNGGNAVKYSYTNGDENPDPTGHIIRVETGVYYMDVSTISLADGVLQYAVWGEPGPSALDETRTEVRSEGQVIIEKASFVF